MSQELEPLSFPYRTQLQVRSDLSELIQVLEWFNQFNHPPLSHFTWLQCQLVLAEGFTNAVRHAHQGFAAETLIEIEGIVTEKALQLKILDHGPGFDLEEVLSQMPSVISSEAEGGRGLKLMQRLADQISYMQTADQRNCLYIVKRW